MTSLLENMHIALPEIILLTTAVLALLGDLFFGRHVKYITLIFGCAGLAIAAFVSFLYLGGFKTLAFSGLYMGDDTANLMKIFICITVLLCFVYSYQYVQERKIRFGDYYVLSLFSTLGMTTLVSAHSMLSIYLGLELLSLPLYAMTAIRRADSKSSEAAMKYFVMGAIASGMLLYGMSLIYGATGQLVLSLISQAISSNWQEHGQLLSFGLVFIIVGIGFKLAAAPFHMWAPDVYDGAPTSVTLLISGAPKIAAIGMAFRMLTIGLPELSVQWQHLLLVLALLSTGLGNLFAIVQTNLKRLFAYSAISHMGYALFGLMSVSLAGYAATLYYVLVYAIMSIAAFGLLVLMSNQGLEVDTIDDLKGMNKRSPWLAFMMMIVMFSMAGVPPTVGFLTKLLVIKALIDAGLVWVAVLGLIFAVIGVFYYLRIIKSMYFDEPFENTPIIINPGSHLIYSINCLSLLFLGIFPGFLIAACVNAFAR